MKRHLAFTSEAFQEIVDAFDGYEEASADLASSFRRELEAALARIADAPDRWPVIDIDTRRFVLRRFPFAVVYTSDGVVITVVALAHHKRRPRYWIRRH